jgi:MYXO-CTERM domain-containing protein
MRKLYGLAQTAFLAAGLTAIPALSQTSRSDVRRETPATGDPTMYRSTDMDRDDDFDFGWLGLVGLAGLAGLRRHRHTRRDVIDHHTVRDDMTTPPRADRM